MNTDLWETVVPTVRTTANFDGFTCDECLDTGTIDRGGVEIVCPYCGGASAVSSQVDVTETAGADTMTIKISGLGWGLGLRGGSLYSTCVASTSSTMTFVGTRAAILSDVTGVRRRAETEASSKGLSGRNSVSSGAIAIEKRVRAALGTTASKHTAVEYMDMDAEYNAAFWRGQAENADRQNRAIQRLRDMKGQEVTVTRGRKIPIGTKGVVFWVGEGNWGWRVGFTDENGQEQWTDARNVELTSEMTATGSKTAMPAPSDFGVAVGDIFVNSWGYDQTNVDYYEVIRLTPQGVEVQPIGARDTGEGGMHLSVVPVRGLVRDFDVILGIERSNPKKSKVCRLREGWRGTPSIVLGRGYRADKWDGTPMYETSPYLGH